MGSGDHFLRLEEGSQISYVYCLVEMRKLMKKKRKGRITGVAFLSNREVLVQNWVTGLEGNMECCSFTVRREGQNIWIQMP